MPSAKYIFTSNVLGTQLPKTNTSGDNFSQITAQRTQKIKQKESNEMKNMAFDFVHPSKLGIVHVHSEAEEGRRQSDPIEIDS